MSRQDCYRRFIAGIVSMHPEARGLAQPRAGFSPEEWNLFLACRCLELRDALAASRLVGGDVVDVARLDAPAPGLKMTFTNKER